MNHVLLGVRCDRCKATVTRQLTDHPKIEIFLAASDDNAAAAHKKRCVGTMQSWIYESPRIPR